MFEYTESVHNKNFILNLSFASSNDPRVTRIPVETISLTAVPENNHYAYYYLE